MQLHSAVFVLPRPIQSEAAGPKAEVKATEGGWRLEASTLVVFPRLLSHIVLHTFSSLPYVERQHPKEE